MVVAVKAYVFVCLDCGKLFFLNEREELLVHALRRNHRCFRVVKVVLHGTVHGTAGV